MRVGISVYPDDTDQSGKARAYIANAKRHDIDILFSSIHITELKLIDQLRAFIKIAELAHEYKMYLIVDISGKTMTDIIEDESLLKLFKTFDIDSLRLDYGVDSQLIKKISDKCGINNFVLNASMLDKRAINEVVSGQLHNCDWQACHNFYPRPETGLSKEFAKKQYKYFKEVNIPVYAFISCLDSARGPLHKGLPTIEEHRKLSLEKAYYDLLDNEYCDGIIIGDPFVNDENIEKLADCMHDQPLTLTIDPDQDLTAIERKTLFDKIHKCRYDSNEKILRLMTSRMISEKAVDILPRTSSKRVKGMVTIDNIGYKRYSGELQIVLETLDHDPKVNIIGKIIEDDLWKLPHIACGHQFCFKLKEQI